MTFGPRFARVGTTQLEGTSYVIAGGDASSFRADNERAYLFNASDGSVVQTFKPSSARRVASAGDLNDDGTPDVLVSNPADTVSGAAGAGSTSVLSGADGSTLLTLHSPNPGEEGEFGTALAGGRDVNGDGLPMGALKDALGRIDLAKLEAMKDEGAQEN